jgi:phosphoribosyl-ATP pyrophosphohydrolase / phosphoribosyl-AMP cyclohydrolase / histidinol dehydrogenase
LSDSSALLAIDMPAGPSELLVIADARSNPSYVVSDLLSQSEHGVDSQVVLVGCCLLIVAVGMSAKEIDRIQDELVKQSTVLPRSSIVKESLSKSFIYSVNTMKEALDFSNEYAPEHLILNVDDAASYVKGVMNAGSVFVGQYSPERY